MTPSWDSCFAGKVDVTWGSTPGPEAVAHQETFSRLVARCDGGRVTSGRRFGGRWYATLNAATGGRATHRPLTPLHPPARGLPTPGPVPDAPSLTHHGGASRDVSRRSPSPSRATRRGRCARSAACSRASGTPAGGASSHSGSRCRVGGPCRDFHTPTGRSHAVLPGPVSVGVSRNPQD